MFLLPGAERQKKKTFSFLFLVCLWLQVFVGFEIVDVILYTLFGFFLKLVVILAGLWSALFQPLSAVAPSLAHVEELPLSRIERLQGKPSPLIGIEWLEAPVIDVDVENGVLTVAAGKDFYLAVDQIVVFGNNFLGRVGEVYDDFSHIYLWNRTGVRTGVALRKDGKITDAVAIGRGLEGEAIVDWVKDESWLDEGASVLWRSRVLDPPALVNNSFFLGTLERSDGFLRGDDYYFLNHVLPASAEGRVFIAATAVGDMTVSEPVIYSSSAERLLFGDAIFGTQVVAVHSSNDFVPSILSDHGRVCGPILEWRGDWGWGKIQTPIDWSGSAVFLQNKSLISVWDATKGAEYLYTRGGLGIPRGLFIGSSDSSAFIPSSTLQVWLAPQSKKEF